MINFITGMIGIVGLAIFLGIMVWWVKALPLIVICVGVGILLVIDFVQSLKPNNNGASR